ncbi:unnamed protein product [Taenia asiatica]|uniref:Secreted protein n=1 Tax=Taenia asiatica TaxID=60517 RepID=A0A0R3VZ40_TAEAS|nr:unnamed protein product [Taenia asiatica]
MCQRNSAVLILPFTWLWHWLSLSIAAARLCSVVVGGGASLPTVRQEPSAQGVKPGFTTGSCIICAMTRRFALTPGPPHTLRACHCGEAFRQHLHGHRHVSTGSDCIVDGD